MVTAPRPVNNSHVNAIATIVACSHGISAIAHLILGAALTAAGARNPSKQKKLRQAMISAVPDITIAATSSSDLSLGLRWTF